MLELTDRIIAYEAGELSDEEDLRLFQDLVDTGMIRHLQGSYQRTAVRLIQSNYIRPPYSIGYRVHSGFNPDGTAADVVRFEEEELGNDLRVLDSMRHKLEDMPASAITWVCAEKKDVVRYGPIEEIVEVRYDEVVGCDGEGGYLVVIREETRGQAS